MYGILRALSDELINRQRQKRSFRLIYRLSIQHIRCVEQRSAYRCLHSVLRARTAFAPRPGKTLHRTVLFPRLRVPFDLTKHRGTQRVPLCLVPVVGLSAQVVLCLHSVLRARTAFAPRPGKTLHRTVLFPPASSPVRHNQTQRHPTGASVFGASGDTAFFKKHSNINGFRTPEQRNYLYSALLKPSISAAIARFISR